MAQRYTQRTDSQPPDDRTYSPEVTSFEQSPGSSQCRARISPLVTDLLIIIDSSSFVKKNFSVFYKFFKIFSTAAFSAGTGEHSRRNSPMVEAVRTALELIPRPSGGLLTPGDCQMRPVSVPSSSQRIWRRPNADSNRIRHYPFHDLLSFAAINSISAVLNQFKVKRNVPQEKTNTQNNRTKMVLSGSKPRQYHFLLPRAAGRSNLAGRFLPGTERLNRFCSLSPLLFQGFLQNHVLDFYGATPLGSTNISQIVPFVNDSASLFSRLVPSLHSQSQPGSGKNPAAQTASFPSGL